jgi:hypothetical protein
MPFLPTVFTLLGEHPRYLRGVVDAFLAAPPERVEDHARACRRRGAEAAAAIVATPLDFGSAAPPIHALIDRYNQVNPPSLLFTLFLGGRSSPPPVMAAPLPPAPAAAGPDALLADIRTCHGGFNVPGFWRELSAGWPEHAGAAWALVRGLPADGAFAAAVQAVAAASREALGGRLAPSPLEFGASCTQTRDIWRIAALYASVIPTMLVEIESLRRALLRAMPASESSLARRVR